MQTDISLASDIILCFDLCLPTVIFPYEGQKKGADAFCFTAVLM